MPTSTLPRKSRDGEKITMASFLSLDARDVAAAAAASTDTLLTATPPAPSLAARIFPPSVRNRTVSGFRRARKLTLQSTQNRPVTAAGDQRCSPPVVRERGAASTAVADKAPQVDHLAFELSDKQDFDIAKEGAGHKDSNDIWSKWLQVSNNLTPVVGIGSSNAATKGHRLSQLARQSWRPSTASAATGSVAWPIRDAKVQEEEDAFSGTKAATTSHSKRPRSTTNETDLDDTQESRPPFVADPTTGGKVALRTLTLLSRPNSGDDLKTKQAKELPPVPCTPSLPTPPPSPLMHEPIRRNHKRIKSQQVNLNDDVHSAYFYYSLSFDVSNDLYPISERRSESFSLDEQGRPDSPTIPLVLEECNLVKYSQEIMRAVNKMQTEDVFFVDTLKVPMQSDTTPTRQSWTARIKRAFSQRRLDSNMETC